MPDIPQRIEARSRREAASLAGKPRYSPGYPCRRGHLAERYTTNAGCVECMKFKLAPQPTPVQRALRMPVFVSVGMTFEQETALELYLLKCLVMFHESVGLVAPINPSTIQWCEQHKRPVSESPC